MVAGAVHVSLKPGFGGAGQEPAAGFQIGFAQRRAMHTAIAGSANLSQTVEILFEAVGVDEEGHALSIPVKRRSSSGAKWWLKIEFRHYRISIWR
jgi:hypothetical protein